MPSLMNANYVIIACLKSESRGKWINRIPGSGLDFKIPGSALRTHVELLGKPSDVNMHSQICLVNLISKDTHLVFSIYLLNAMACF